MIVRSASSSASFGFPAKRRRRTSARFFAPSGLLRSRFSPAQIVSSLSWIRSEWTPPNTIAPRRPFPIGRASFQEAAGCRNQSTSGLLAVTGACAENEKSTKQKRRLMLIVSPVRASGRTPDNPVCSSGIQTSPYAIEFHSSRFSMFLLVEMEYLIHLRPPFSCLPAVERALHRLHDRPPFLCLRVRSDARHILVMIRPVVFVIREEKIVFQKDGIVANIRAPDGGEYLRPDITVIFPVAFDLTTFDSNHESKALHAIFSSASH